MPGRGRGSVLDTIHWLSLNFVMTPGDKDSPLCFANEAIEMLGTKQFVHGHTATIQYC